MMAEGPRSTFPSQKNLTAKLYIYCKFPPHFISMHLLDGAQVPTYRVNIMTPLGPLNPLQK